MATDPRAKAIDEAIYIHKPSGKRGTMEWAPLEEPGSISRGHVGIFWPSDGSEWDYVRGDEIEAVAA